MNIPKPLAGKRSLTTSKDSTDGFLFQALMYSSASFLV